MAKSENVKTIKHDADGFYDIEPILKTNSKWNLIFGERGNGKTFAALRLAIRRYVEERRTTCYVRRWTDDVKKDNIRNIFLPLATPQGTEKYSEIEKITNGEYNTVKFQGKHCFLASIDEDGKYIKEDPDFFCRIVCLSDNEHVKSTAFGNVKTIIFDEFMTRDRYLSNEFVKLIAVVSSAMRLNPKVQVIMLANTVNLYGNPYFREMGIKHAAEQEQGTIDMYRIKGQYKDDNTISVEYCSECKANATNKSYFCFDNPRLEMVTKGAWEMEIYPHLPCAYSKKDVRYSYFIYFDGYWLKADIVYVPTGSFTFVYNYEEPPKIEEDYLYFTPEPSERPNVFRKITVGSNKKIRTIAKYFQDEKVFYEDNSVGELVRAYVQWCRTNRVI